MTNCPQHSYFIDLIERIFCIYEQKSQILRGQIFVSNRLSPVDCAINSHFESGTHMVILTRHGGFRLYAL